MASTTPHTPAASGGNIKGSGSDDVDVADAAAVAVEGDAAAAASAATATVTTTPTTTPHALASAEIVPPSGSSLSDPSYQQGFSTDGYLTPNDFSTTPVHSENENDDDSSPGASARNRQQQRQPPSLLTAAVASCSSPRDDDEQQAYLDYVVSDDEGVFASGGGGIGIIIGDFDEDDDDDDDDDDGLSPGASPPPGGRQLLQQLSAPSPSSPPMVPPLSSSLSSPPVTAGGAGTGAAGQQETDEEGCYADDEGAAPPLTPVDTKGGKKKAKAGSKSTPLSPMLLSSPFTNPRRRRRPRDPKPDGSGSTNKEREAKSKSKSGGNRGRAATATADGDFEEGGSAPLRPDEDHPLAFPNTADRGRRRRQRAESMPTTALLRIKSLWGTSSSSQQQQEQDATAPASATGSPAAAASASAASVSGHHKSPSLTELHIGGPRAANISQGEIDFVLGGDGEQQDEGADEEVASDIEVDHDVEDDDEAVPVEGMEYEDDEEEDVDVDVSDDSWDDLPLVGSVDEAGMECYETYAHECQQLDWSELPPLPIRFCLAAATTAPSTSSGLIMAPPYLDQGMLPDQGTTLLERESKRFAVEQGLFLQSVLQLLAERDQVGVEGSIESGDNIWKKGPLKKLSFGGGRMKRPGAVPKWKVKYVELRQGNLCYYDDAGKDRETIHLRQDGTVIQESPPNKGHPGFGFELNVQGAPTHYWMASSEEERQSWMRAVQKAMIGDEGPRRELDLTPHQEALEVYKAMRGKIEQANSKELYLEAIQSSMQEMQDDDILQVPAEWIRDQTKQAENESGDRPLLNKSVSKRNVTPHRQLKTSITEFWKTMGQTTFSINGITVPRDTPLASARVFGALTRSILEFDKAFGVNQEEESTTAGQMTELQAVSYTRNILLAILRSKEEQLTATAVHHLLKNPDLVVISKKDDEESVVDMEVSFAGEELPDEFLPPISDEMAGWLWIRRSKQLSKTSKKRYVVLSGAALTYYEAATPRPVGLRGQLILQGATLTQHHQEVEGEERFMLTISTPRHDERTLSFDNESDLLEWKEALQAAVDSCPDDAEAAEADDAGGGDAATPEGRARGPIRRSADLAQGVAESVIKGADETIRGGVRVMKGAKDGGIKVIKTSTDVSMKVLRGAGDSSMKVVRAVAGDGGVKVIRTATEGGMKVGRKVVRGTVGRLRPSRSSSGSDYDAPRGGRMTRRPSMQVLLNNTALSGKRDEPTVQCIFQVTSIFRVRAKNYEEGGEERWLSVSAKLYQAFLLLGGPSGRIARGDALIELDFGETDPDDGALFAF